MPQLSRDERNWIKAAGKLTGLHSGEDSADREMEDLPMADRIQSNVQRSQNSDTKPRSREEMARVLEDLGLQDLDLEECEVSRQWKDKLLHIIEQYGTIFSRDKMDCGNAKDFVHRTKVCRTGNQSAKQVASRLWNDFFLVYGFPKRIHSDQGANFESKLIEQLLEMAGVKKSHTTPYHPMGNGITERFNRTLGNMIRALPPQSKAKWPHMLQMLTFCYNCTEHETTGFAPFYLMFGRIPRLPIDVMFQHVLPNDTIVSHQEFVTKLKRDLNEAALIAQRHSLREQVRHSKLYDGKVKGSPLVIGDRVLLANRGERGKRKVADKWDLTPYEVMSVRSTINVYRIKDVQTAKEKVVHRNLLLPVSFLSLSKDVDQDPAHSDCDTATCRSDHAVAMPDEVEDCGVRTRHWLMQTEDDVSGLGLEEDGKPGSSSIIVSGAFDLSSHPDVLVTPHKLRQTHQTLCLAHNLSQFTLGSVATLNRLHVLFAR
ncbi:hypothetical protein SKAU_G00061510 [Synaphobranchus kaupii]|uniref:Integrase catalytic domain-containing protein n=1 Tax=Synaphobranchus kaupii TaxID=118154 RepID=A0A9Q1J9M6_SYNKA|nr:hypothetical protein SKAU_G00061510 [Synaphobranchus kaupii]